MVLTESTATAGVDLAVTATGQPTSMWHSAHNVLEAAGYVAVCSSIAAVPADLSQPKSNVQSSMCRAAHLALVLASCTCGHMRVVHTAAGCCADLLTGDDEDGDEEEEPEDSSDSDYGSARNKAKAKKPVASRKPARAAATKVKAGRAAGHSRTPAEKVRPVLLLLAGPT